jgi:hypothetical protein
MKKINNSQTTKIVKHVELKNKMFSKIIKENTTDFEEVLKNNLMRVNVQEYFPGINKKELFNKVKNRINDYGALENSDILSIKLTEFFKNSLINTTEFNLLSVDIDIISRKICSLVLNQNFVINNESYTAVNLLCYQIFWYYFNFKKVEELESKKMVSSLVSHLIISKKIIIKKFKEKTIKKNSGPYKSRWFFCISDCEISLLLKSTVYKNEKYKKLPLISKPKNWILNESKCMAYDGGYKIYEYKKIKNNWSYGF